MTAFRPLSDRPKSAPKLPPLSLSLLAQPVMIAFAVVVVVFAVYEVIERTWLTGVELHTLHLLHRIRGLFSALLAAFLVGWFILKQSLPFLATALSTDNLTNGHRPKRDERLTAYAQWFILMRWIAVLVAGVLIVITIWVAEMLPQQVWWPLFSTVAALAALNLMYMVLIRHGFSKRRLLSTQAYADLVILTMLLHFSGGLENPLAPLVIFHVVIAGIVLSRRDCYLVATTAVGLMAIMALAELTGLIPHYTLEIFPHAAVGGHVAHASHDTLYVISWLVLQSAILFLTAFFVSTLSERLRKDEYHMEAFAERVLTERQMLKQALETTGSGLCVCDASLQQQWSNHQWDSWFGAVPDDSEAFHQIHGAGCPAELTLKDGSVRVWELTVPEEGDSEQLARTYQTTTAALRDTEGRIGHVVQLVQDITTQKRAQEFMMRASRLAAVGELAGQVAHEVNNPNAIISAKARLLLANERERMTDKTASELVKITELSDRIARVAQGLLSYCRHSTGTRTLLDLREPLRKALSLVEQRTAASGVTVVDRLEKRSLMVCANSHEMEQVFMNLLLNSLDVMPGGGTLTISARAERKKKPHVILIIEDSGPGIPRHLRDRIFEPFFTTKEEGSGTGLGLSICQGIIQSHDGTITAGVTAEGGAQMTIRLPAAQIPRGVDQDVEIASPHR